MRIGLVFGLAMVMVLTGISLAPGEAEAGNSAGDVLYVPTDYPTIQDAVDASGDGDRIHVAAGEWFGAVVDKDVEIRGEDGAVIVDGPSYSPPGGNPYYMYYLHAGFRLDAGAGGDGATISHFEFECIDAFTAPGLTFPVFSRDVDEVTVSHCIMHNSLQGVTNWMGDGWNIHHNVIDGLQAAGGGGIGIMMGVVDGTESNDNVVSHNRITAIVGAPDYSPVGVSIYSDHRWGRLGGVLSGNEISFNHIDINGENANGIELSLAGVTINVDDVAVSEIFGNTIVRNDVSSCGDGIDIWPEVLYDVNTIERNKV